jgi:hypothetical protein
LKIALDGNSVVIGIGLADRYLSNGEDFEKNILKKIDNEEVKILLILEVI